MTEHCKRLPSGVKTHTDSATLAARLNSLVKKARFVTDSAETIPQCPKAVLILF
jgi:hypothetical protein